MKQRLLLLVPTTTYRAKAFLRAAQRLEIDVTVASEEPSSLAEHHPTALLSMDFGTPGRAARDILEFAKSHPVHGVVAVDDQVTLLASAVGRALGLPHNPEEAAYATRNKLRLRETLAAAHVPSPAFRPVKVDDDPNEAAGSAHYPCVMKPLMMAASRGVIRVDDPRGFVAAFERIRRLVRAQDAPDDEASRTTVLVEEYIRGREVAVEGIVTDGRLHVFTIFDKPDPLEGPYFPETIYVYPSRMPESAKRSIENIVQAAVTALGLRYGPVHAEVRGEDEDMKLIEIASRSIGGYCSKVLRFRDGLSLEDVIVRHALRMNDGRVPLEGQAAGVMMLQAPTEGIFKAVRGVEAAEAIDGIDEFILSAWKGQKLSPLPEGFLYLGFLFARANTPKRVESALRAAYEKLEFVIDTA